jgi:hypothetical protein
MNKKLSILLARPDIWQASASPQQTCGITTGHPGLDENLHQGGWPVGAVTELLCDHSGMGELQVLSPALAQCTQQGRKLVFVSPPYMPYAPALQHAGISLSQVVIVQVRSATEQLWAVNQLLQADIAGAVLTWLADGTAKHNQLRKLQLAAQASHGLTILFRPGRAATEASPAALRIALTPTQKTCRLHILKQRGGWPGQIIDINHANGLIQANIPVSDLPVHQPPQHPPLQHQLAEQETLTSAFLEEQPDTLPSRRYPDTSSTLH